MGVGGQRHFPTALPQGKEKVPIVEGYGWAPDIVWTGGEILTLHRDSIPDRPVRIESLYRLSHPGPRQQIYTFFVNYCVEMP